MALSEDAKAAFKAELPGLRKTLRTIQRARRKRYPDVPALKAQSAPCRDRLEYWRKVLMVDERRIHSPVALWDRWKRLLDMAELNAVELDFLQRRDAA